MSVNGSVPAISRRAASVRARLSALVPAVGTRRIVNVLGVTQIVSWGTTFYAPTVLAAPLTADMGWSKTAVYGAFSFALVVGALLAQPVGRLIDRAGGRWTMAAGSLIAAAGLLMASLATSIAVYWAAWAVLGIAMRLVLYEAAFATLARAAGDEARRAISILTLYGGFASTIFWPIGWALVDAYGWRAAFAIFAVLNLLVCLPLHALLLPGEAPAPQADAPSPTTHAEGVLMPSERRFARIVLTLCFALFMYANAALSAHLVDTLVVFGLTAAMAVSLSALRGVGQVTARLWEILFAARLRPMTLCLIAIGLTPVALLSLAGMPLLVCAAAFAFLQGASNGLITIVRGIVPLLLFGARGYGALIGAMTAPALLSTALAPAVHAALVDYGGHVVALLVVLLSVTLALALAALLAWRLRGATAGPVASGRPGV